MKSNKKIKRIIFLTVVLFFLISLSLVAFAQTQIIIDLKPGWNLISSPSKIDTNKLGDAECEIDAKIYSYSADWKTFTSGDLEPGRGYWVKVKDACSLSVSQGECKDITLQKNWNLIGVYKDISISGINCINGNAYDYDYENGRWITTKYLKAGKGYWVFANGDNCKIPCAAPNEMTFSFPKFDYSASGGKIENCLLDTGCKKAMAVIECDDNKWLLWSMGFSDNKIKFGIASCSDSKPAELEVGDKNSPKEYECTENILNAGTTSGSICKQMYISEDDGNIFVKLTKPDSCSQWSLTAIE